MCLSNVTSIGQAAFEQCYGLTSVTNIGESVFAYDYEAMIYYLPGTIGWSNTFAGHPTMLWNPQIQTSGPSFGVRSNQFGFNITGTTNIPIAVEACTNLANPVWTPLTNVTLSNGWYYFSDHQWTNYPGRFYGIGFP